MNVATADARGVEGHSGPVCRDLPPEAAAANLIQKLGDNPMLREPALLLIGACGQLAEEGALLERVGAELSAHGALPVQPLSAVLRMLVESGAVAEFLTVDGAPYEGTLEDAFEDDSLAEGAATLIWAQATEVGGLVTEALAPAHRAAALFADFPQHAIALRLVLRLCDCAGGRSTAALHDALDAEGLLRRDPRTGIPQVYPSLFANLLKDAGCLTWDHAWLITDLGRQVLAAPDGADAIIEVSAGTSPF